MDKSKRVLSPIFTSWTLLFFSGIPLLEEKVNYFLCKLFLSFQLTRRTTSSATTRPTWSSRSAPPRFSFYRLPSTRLCPIWSRWEYKTRFVSIFFCMTSQIRCTTHCKCLIILHYHLNLPSVSAAASSRSTTSSARSGEGWPGTTLRRARYMKIGQYFSKVLLWGGPIFVNWSPF